MYFKGKRGAVPRRRGAGDFHGYGPAIRRTMAEHLPRRAGVRALDVGTGFGRTTAFLARRLAGQSHVWSLDPSREMLDVAWSLLRRRGLASRVTMMTGTVDLLPFPEGTFDLVTSVMALHHLPHVRRGLREMVRVARPRGRLLLVDWKAAASVLPFAHPHRPGDFVPPAAAAGHLEALGLRPRLREFPLWYLVVARRG